MELELAEGVGLSERPSDRVALEEADVDSFMLPVPCEDVGDGEEAPLAEAYEADPRAVGCALKVAMEAVDETEALKQVLTVDEGEARLLMVAEVLPVLL